MVDGESADVSLDEASVAGLLEEQLPALGVRRVERLGDAGDHLVFDLDGRWIVRFPRSAEAAARLGIEVRLLDRLASRLPLAIPSYRFFGQPSEVFPFTFAGYPKLEGTPALRVELRAGEREALGLGMGDFLRRLHGQDARAAEALGVLGEEDSTLEARAGTAFENLRTAREHALVASADAPTWARMLSERPRAALAPRLVHGGFAAEHVLLDEAHRAVAVLDWSAVALGDPAQDLAGLLCWGGKRMLDAALERYGAVDPETARRVRYYALCRALGDLVFGETQRRPAYVVAGLRALGFLAL